jgi:hypothetical protein
LNVGDEAQFFVLLCSSLKHNTPLSNLNYVSPKGIKTSPIQEHLFLPEKRSRIKKEGGDVRVVGVDSRQKKWPRQLINERIPADISKRES